MESKENITSKKVRLMIEVKSKKYVYDTIGFTQHTLNRRLAYHDWKPSEVFLIDHMYENIKKGRG